MSDFDSSCPRCQGKGLVIPQTPAPAKPSTSQAGGTIQVDKQSQFIDRMNERMDNEEKANRVFWGAIGGYCGLMIALLAVIIMALIIGSIWVAIFGPAKP